MLKTSIIILLLCIHSSAFAYFADGNKLVSEMREFENAERSAPGTDWTKSASYVGYVVGVHDSISYSLCSAENVSVRQVATVVSRYLNDNPAEWSDPAHHLVAKALRKAFPCR